MFHFGFLQEAGSKIPFHFRFTRRLVPRSGSTSSERLLLELSSSMSWRLVRLSSASIPISSRRGFFWGSRFTIRWGPIPDLVRALSSDPETQRNKTIQDPKPANSDNQGHAVIWIFKEPPVPFLRDFRIRELLLPVHRESKNCQSWLFQKSKILGGCVTFSIFWESWLYTKTQSLIFCEKHEYES